jgi:hypothetical protein
LVIWSRGLQYGDQGDGWLDESWATTRGYEGGRPARRRRARDRLRCIRKRSAPPMTTGTIRSAGSVTSGIVGTFWDESARSVPRERITLTTGGMLPTFGV